MRSGGGKAKGAGFERDVCKLLSKWVTGGKRFDVFWRSAMSGGRATVAGKRGEELVRQAGDISSVSPEGHSLTNRFYVECKSYNDLALEAFFIRGSGKLAGFWEQTLDQATRYKRSPLLIAKQARTPTLVIMKIGQATRLVRNPSDWTTVVQEFISCDVFRFDRLLERGYLRNDPKGLDLDSG